MPNGFVHPRQQLAIDGRAITANYSSYSTHECFLRVGGNLNQRTGTVPGFCWAAAELVAGDRSLIGKTATGPNRFAFRRARSIFCFSFTRTAPTATKMK